MAVEEFINNYNYFYTNVFDTKVLFKILKFRIKNKLRIILRKQNKSLNWLSRSW